MAAIGFILFVIVIGAIVFERECTTGYPDWIKVIFVIMFFSSIALILLSVGIVLWNAFP